MPPTYFSRLRIAAQRSFLERESAIQDSVKVLRNRWSLGNTKDFHSSSSSILAEFHVYLRPGTVITARLDAVDWSRKKVSIIGALPHTVSVPSISGPAFRICGYHVDCALGEPKQSSVAKKLDLQMPTCGSRASFGECVITNLLSNYKKLPASEISPCIYYASIKFENCLKASMQLKNRGQNSSSVIYGYFASAVAKRLSNSYLHSSTGARYVHSSPSLSSSAGTASDKSPNNAACVEQDMKSANSSEQGCPSVKSLKLISGSCYLPHPEKEETGGEDAHFICVDEHAIGVADGVGGWADYGVDAGQYSRELMSNSVIAIQDEPKGSIDPARVLEKAHLSTKAKGSSTACIVALTDQGLHAINLGDSGFMVVRDGCTVFRSPVQQHDFNFTYQLESGDNGDLPSSGQVFTIPVAPGDVIIAGTDGLFDNLYNNEITAVVVNAARAGLGCQVTAQKLAALARQRAQDKNRQTPFSTAAQEAGFRYHGGKLDDITVVVSYITSCDDK